MNLDLAVYLGAFAAIGFVLKIAILFEIKITGEISKRFAILCLFMTLQNAAEFLAYFTYFNSRSVSVILIHSYIIAIYFIYPAVLLLALSLGNFTYLKLARNILFGISCLLTYAHVMGWVVSGVKIVGWAAVTVPGTLYSISIIYILFCAIACVVYLLTQSFKNDDYKIRFNCKINIIAFIPLLALAFAVYSLRFAGYNSTSAVSGALATLFFMFVMLLYINGNAYWIYTKFKSVLAILKMNKQASIDDLLRELEKVRIQEALKLTSGKQNTAASILGLPTPKLNKLISKYNIDINSYK